MKNWLNKSSIEKSTAKVNEQLERSVAPEDVRTINHLRLTGPRRARRFAAVLTCCTAWLSALDVSSSFKEKHSRGHFEFEVLRNVHGVVMSTRIFVTARLLDYAVTGSNDDEHWHWGPHNSHARRVPKPW